MIIYFVTFVIQGPHGPCFGSADIRREQPISSVHDVNAVKAWLAQQGYRNPTVLGFSPYASNNQPGNPRTRSRR